MARNHGSAEQVLADHDHGRVAVEQEHAALLHCLRRLDAARHCREPERLVDFVSRELGATLNPVQVRSEIIALLELLRQRRPRTVLEIGTANGGTLFLFSRVVAPDASLISVDLPGGYGEYPPWKEVLFKSFGRLEQAVHLVRADSHDPATLEKVRSILNGRRLDFLFIDGDHHYAGVKRDFEMYAPLVEDGGIIAFHDIVPLRPAAAWCEVDRFWLEIKDAYPHRQIVADSRQSGCGIGVLERKGA